MKIILENFRESAKINNLMSKFLDRNSISHPLCTRNTGFNKIEFIEIADHLEMKNSGARTITQELAVHLFWLKTSVSQEVIAIYYECKC